MTDKKSNIVLTVSTAIFAVLSLCLIITFKLNENFFDTHGRIGALAQIEQEDLLEENAKAYSYKRNISININDENKARLVLPLLSKISAEDIAVREEFTSKKLVITLKNQIDAVKNGTTITTDSSIMEAVGLYKQESDIVLEIYEKDIYGYEISTNENELIVAFKNVNELYDKKIVIYIPYEDKDRLYSEEWITALNAIKNEKDKIFLCSAMKEEYREEDVLNFANEVNADMVLGIDYVDTAAPEYMEIIYNGKYFIPDFGSPELSVFLREGLEEKTDLYVTAYTQATASEILVNNSKTPVALAKIYVQTKNEGIEERYTLNHSVMEGISLTLKNIKNYKETE